MKSTPHQHFGQVELCYNRFCTRVTTSEQAAAAIEGGFLGALAGAILTRNSGGVVAGAIVGALLGAISSAEGSSESSYSS